jgi:proline iminopeptidase
MKLKPGKYRLLFLLLFLSVLIPAQKLYIKTFGKSGDKPVIFLHGGPGYNCANFEATTAKRLSENGFFVVVYDRRGEGRSKDSAAKFTFEQTLQDINSICSQYNIVKPSLIGHSFGGIVAVKYAMQFPQNVSSIFFVGAPVSLQETFQTIIDSSREIYKTKKDTHALRELGQIEKLDRSSDEFFSECFTQAGKNRFYSTKNPGEEMKAIYKTFWKDTLVKWSFRLEIEAPSGFHKNEHYTMLDLGPEIKSLVSKKLPLYGLYGKDDGLFSPKQVSDLADIIGKENVKYIDNCSHNVFIDQQTAFIDALREWTK